MAGAAGGNRGGMTDLQVLQQYAARGGLNRLDRPAREAAQTALAIGRGDQPRITRKLPPPPLPPAATAPAATVASAATAPAGQPMTPAGEARIRRIQQRQEQQQRRAEDLAEQQRQAAEDAAAEDARARAEAERRSQGMIIRVLDMAQTFLRGLNARAKHVPTPGGLGALFLALILLVFASVPASNGYTRLNLYFLTLTGRTSLPSQSAGGASSSSTQSATTSGALSTGAAGIGGGGLIPSFSRTTGAGVTQQGQVRQVPLAGSRLSAPWTFPTRPHMLDMLDEGD